MNCQACKYQRQIDALRKRCLACNPDDGGGIPHGRVEATEFTLSRPIPVDYSRTPSEQATNLAPDQEHRLRMAMASYFGLDDLDRMLVGHLMQGGTLESFGSRMQQLAREIARYRGSPRAMAWARKRAIARKMPLLAPILCNTAENDAAGRVESELDREDSCEA